MLSWDGVEAQDTARDSRSSREGIDRDSFSSTDRFALRCVPFVFPMVMFLGTYVYLAPF